jgi:hypothetical protein
MHLPTTFADEKSVRGTLFWQPLCSLVKKGLWKLCGCYAKSATTLGCSHPVIAISLAKDAALQLDSPCLVCLFGSTQSDLRVRHRDETKNVTRLTMENVSHIKCCLCFSLETALVLTHLKYFPFLQMNLASRCREAISHVAMLKKELEMHQRRAADALAMQRQQQTQRYVE